MEHKSIYNKLNDCYTLWISNLVNSIMSLRASYTHYESFLSTIFFVVVVVVVTVPIVIADIHVAVVCPCWNVRFHFLPSFTFLLLCLLFCLASHPPYGLMILPLPFIVHGFCWRSLIAVIVLLFLLFSVFAFYIWMFIGCYCYATGMRKIY